MSVRDHARTAYDALAPHYDRLTAHHRYDEWTADLERLARDAGLRGRRLLDVACGTGKSFLPFLCRGYEVTACDVSPAMLALARDKAGSRVRIEERDMRALPRLGAFDLVTCLDDAVNYLHEPAEVAALMAGIARNLDAGGVALFDANTLQAYRTFFGSLDVLAAEDSVLIWRGRTPHDLEAGGLAEAEIEALVRGEDGWRREAHVHLQRHHPEATIRRAVAAAGLEVAGVHGMQLDGSFEIGFAELRNSKAVYVVTASGTRPA